MKENVKNVIEKQENMGLNSVNFKKNSEFLNTRLAKNYQTFYEIKKFCVFLCFYFFNFFYFFRIYKIYLISDEGYEKAGVDFLIIKKLAKFG